MDKWEQLKESINQMYDRIDKQFDNAVEEARKQSLAEIESAKNDSVLDELKKVNDRLARLEAKLPDSETED